MTPRRTVLPVDHADVAGALRRLAVPSALAMTADQLLGIVDTIVIGFFGPAALAGITAASGVFVTVVIPLFAFNAGTRIMGAQAVGAGNMERFGRIVRASAVVPFAIAVAGAAASLAVGRPLMHAMLGGISSADAAAAYLVLRCVSMIPIVVSGVAIAAFAAAGDTRLALRVLLVINLVHIPLLVVLALGLGTHHPLRLTGAGISSLTSEIVGAFYCVWQIRRRPEFCIAAERTIDFRLARAAAALGWPEFVFLVLLVVPEPVTIALLAPLGVMSVAAFRALSIVSDVTWAIPGSLGEADQIVVGQRLGAADLTGARHFSRSAIRYAVVVCFGVGAAVAVLARPLAQLFTLSAALAVVAAGPLALHMLTLPLKGFAMTTLAPIRASGDTRFSMWMGLLSGSISLGGIYLGIVVLHAGLWAVPFAWIAAWTARAIATLLRLRTGAWEKRRFAEP
jgi:putative MATE family efflux protein